jgi:ABC-2 type transport system permease protein
MNVAEISTARPGRLRILLARLRTSAWLGWQIESNWADPFLFVIYTVMRPLAMALILAGMYWAVAGQAMRRESFQLFYLANAFHVYVTQLLVGMGWVVVEEREDFETLKYVYASPIGMFTYLAGRCSVKLVLATVSCVLALAVGWFALGLRWDWSQVAWAPLAVTLVLGLVASVWLGFLIAGASLMLPRVAITLNEGLGVALYLLCGVIFPIDLLPRGVQELSLALPFTYWYEALRRFLVGHGASQRLSHWSDGALLLALFVATVVFSALSRWGYLAFDRRARQLGRLDQGTLF